MDNHNNTKKNMVWESKGIMLGIILFILHNNYRIKHKKIIVNNDIFHFILKKLFPDFKFKLYANNAKKNNFVINIRNNIQNGLIINNLNNIQTINGAKVHLLPWYDHYNPVVMYEYNESKTIDVTKMKNKIDRFTKLKRYMIYDETNFIEESCNFRSWDTFFEHYIYHTLWIRYGHSKVSTYEFISDMLSNKPCYYDSLNILYYPVFYDRVVKVPVIQTLIKEVEKEIVKTEYTKDVDPNYNSLIDLLRKKLEILNNIFENKQKNI